MNSYSDNMFEMAPCLKEGPLAVAGRKLLSRASKLDNTILHSILKTWVAYDLFISTEAFFKLNEDPTKHIVKRMEDLSDYLDAAGAVNFAMRILTVNKDMEKIEKETGEHYATLFKDFDDHSYYEEAENLLRTRIERNGIDISGIKDWKVLDAGCGGGRYSVAWADLGARSVVGVDISETNIHYAKKKNAKRFPNVSFISADVLEMPFNKDSFDVVFSNGVLHHTSNWKKGISELVRVLKPNCLGWLYLIEKPGGYFWDIIEILRVMMSTENKNIVRAGLKILGIPPNKIFYMLDHIIVPINIRLTEEEIENCFCSFGTRKVRKLLRGADFDRSEQIYRKVQFSDIKYGVGEQRYIFTK